MNTKTITFLFAVCLTPFLIGNATAASVQQPCMAGVSTAETTATDPDMGHWKKQRALYLHDLRLSALEQKNDQLSKTDFDKANALIEADLYLAYAEADQIMLGDAKTARTDLTKAQKNLDKVHNLASTAEKAKIETIDKTVIARREADATCNRQAPDRELKSYEMLHKDIRKLERQIG
jgi:hypothetical protein